jgi:hypothetical protein
MVASRSVKRAFLRPGTKRGRKSLKTLGGAGKMAATPKRRLAQVRLSLGWLKRPRPYWQSARALAVHCPKPLATMLRMTEQT